MRQTSQWGRVREWTMGALSECVDSDGVAYHDDLVKYMERTMPFTEEDLAIRPNGIPAWQMTMNTVLTTTRGIVRIGRGVYRITPEGWKTIAKMAES